MRETYKLQRVENLPRPAEIEEGVFYLSEDGKDSVHKCPCGCGEEIYLLLNSKDIDDFSYDCNVINNEQQPCDQRYTTPGVKLVIL